jgi:enoyl-CoA hydratase/carnithine racemase
MRPGQELTRQIETYPKPIIAAVNGLAYGGGCELVESIHMAVASETARFSKSEINIGIIPTFGGTQRLARNVGRKAAIELILTGRVFTAEEASQLGLVNQIVTEDKSFLQQLLSDNISLRSRLSLFPRHCMQFIVGWMLLLKTVWRLSRLLFSLLSVLPM